MPRHWQTEMRTSRLDRSNRWTIGTSTVRAQQVMRPLNNILGYSSLRMKQSENMSIKMEVTIDVTCGGTCNHNRGIRGTEKEDGMKSDVRGRNGDGAVSHVNDKGTQTPVYWMTHEGMPFGVIGAEGVGVGTSRRVICSNTEHVKVWSCDIPDSLWDTVPTVWRRNCKRMLLGHTRTVCPPESCGSVYGGMTLWYWGGRTPFRERGIGCSHS